MKLLRGGFCMVHPSFSSARWRCLQNRSSYHLKLKPHHLPSLGVLIPSSSHCIMLSFTFFCGFGTFWLSILFDSLCIFHDFFMISLCLFFVSFFESLSVSVQCPADHRDDGEEDSHGGGAVQNAFGKDGLHSASKTSHGKCVSPFVFHPHHLWNNDWKTAYVNTPWDYHKCPRMPPCED